jgi:protein-disulfide isomerase
MSEDSRPLAGDWKKLLIVALLGILIGAGAVYLASGRLVRSYILENPEIISEAFDRLQDRQMAEAVDRHRTAIETPFHGAWAGSRRPEVVLVEYFDYACGYCRASNADVERLLREDPGLRVVWREYPVLGPDSERAAITSLAAAKGGHYRDYYGRLFAAGRPNAATIDAARASVGLGEVALTDEFRREIQTNMEVARAIGAQGTPTFVVGDKVLHGAVGYEALKDAIAEARAARQG